MGMHKKILQIIAVGVSVVVMGTSAYTENPELVEIMDEVCALSDSTTVLIKETADDLTVIPDKYNTGAKGELSVVKIASTINGVEFVSSCNDTRNVLDFAYRNKSISGTVVFEGYDFSNYELWSYNEDKVDRKIEVVFNNCKFSKVALGKTEGNLSYKFNNCTIVSANGSNIVFNNCQFGKSYADGLVPFQNVEVNNCFFSDMAGVAATGGELHTDGTQLYGIAGIDVENVHYNNCRFEIPPFKIEGSSASVNACIMMQLEYSNAKDVSFENCIVNGGGYSLYAWDKNTGRTFTNVTFSDIRSGCAKAYGTVYSQINADVDFDDINETETLYVASIWQDGSNTHFSVSNDTNQERTLLVCTDKGQYEYVIPACPKGLELTTSMSYADMPFDMDIVVPEICEYAICYDNTLDGYARQIRFINWSGQNVYVEKSFVQEMTSRGDDVIMSGSCGTNVSYTLSKDGTLTLRGNGNTTTYNSSKFAPWTECADSIRKIVVEEGIDKLGGQIFKGCAGVKSVSLPDSLLVIDNRAFAGCTGLETITFPAGIEKIGSAIFAGAILQEVLYEGADWSVVEVGSGNESIEAKLTYVSPVEEVLRIIAQGECGKNAKYVLTEDGVLTIIGIGATYNYNSVKVAPWYENREMIKKVVVKDGITKVGEQLFRNCKNIEKIELAYGVSVIGKNAFISCANLREIEIPMSVSEIQIRAFSGIGNVSVLYEGTVCEWQAITIGAYNTSILNNIKYL